MNEESRPKRSAPEEADDGDRKRSALRRQEEEGTTNDDLVNHPPHPTAAEEPISLADVSSKEAAETFTELMTVLQREKAWFRENIDSDDWAIRFFQRLERDLAAFPEIAKVTSIYEGEEKSLLTALLRTQMFEALQQPSLLMDVYLQALKCLIRPNPHALLWCEHKDWYSLTPPLFTWLAEHFPWILRLVRAKYPDKNPVHSGFHCVGARVSRSYGDSFIRDFYGHYPSGLLETDKYGRVPLLRVLLLKLRLMLVYPKDYTFGLIKWMVEACPASLQAPYRDNFGRPPDRIPAVAGRFPPPRTVAGQLLTVCMYGAGVGRGLSAEEVSQKFSDIRELCNMLLESYPDLFRPEGNDYSDLVEKHIFHAGKWNHRKPALHMIIILMRIQLHLRLKTRYDYQGHPLLSFCQKVYPLLQEEAVIIKEREVLRKAAVLMKKYTPPATEEIIEEKVEKKEEEDEDSSHHHLWSTVFPGWLEARLACKVSEIPRVRSIRASIKTVKEE